ncbi:MAG: hypothetical protein ACI9LO_001305 [Planctomycetota bacterium]|jgi:hypothetical protein
MGTCSTSFRLLPLAGLSLVPSQRRSLGDALLKELQPLFASVDLASIIGPQQPEPVFETTESGPQELLISIFPSTDWDNPRNGYLIFYRNVSQAKRDKREMEIKSSTVEPLLACTNRANQTNNLPEALEDCLTIICSFENWLYRGWLVARAFLLDERQPDQLISSKIWCHKNNPTIEPFVELTEKTILRKGEGIPGHVLETGNPVWHGKLEVYKNMPRAELADRCGLVSLVGISIHTSTNAVVGVLAFFADDERSPGPQLMDVLVSIGRALGSVYSREQSSEQLRLLADHDSLTGLKVMRIARDRISQAQIRAERQRELAAVLFIDLDGFKAESFIAIATSTSF